MLEYITKKQLQKLENDIVRCGIDADYIIDGFTMNKILNELRIRRNKAKKNAKIMAAMRKKLEKVNNDESV